MNIKGVMMLVFTLAGYYLIGDFKLGLGIFLVIWANNLNLLSFMNKGRK